MASAVNDRRSSELRGQEIRKLLSEAEITQFGLEVERGVTEATFCDGWERSSDNLKAFLMKELRGAKMWQEVVDSLRQRVEAIEKEEEQERRLEEMQAERERIKAEIMREMQAKYEERLAWDRRSESRRRVGGVRVERPRGRAADTGCYTCGEKGHIARDCPKRINKTTFGCLYKEKMNLKGAGSPEERVEEDARGLGIKRLRTGFPEVLDSEDKPIEYSGIERCRIKTIPGRKVVKKGGVVPEALRQRAREYLDDLERRKVIRRSLSEWRNPIRVIEKPNGGLRIVSNFIALNDLVEKDPYELANIRDVIRATQGSMWFTVIDLKDGFYHIEIEEEDKQKTAFEFAGTVYEWNSMVMGFKNSPQILQRVMNRIMGGLRGNGVEVNMDDIIVHARTTHE